MSSILLANPYVTPAPPPSLSSTLGTAAIAVAPALATSASRSGGQGSAQTGSGSGSDQQAQLAYRRSSPTFAERPADATGNSIVNAQTLGQTTDLSADAPFGSNLPEVQMPDPLPTSPFLKRG